MISNGVGLFIFCIVGVAMFVSAAEESELDTARCNPIVKKVQKEMYFRMSAVSQRLLGSYSYPELDGPNLQFFPLIDTVKTNMAWVYLFYLNNLPWQYKDDFMEEPLKAAKELVKFLQKWNKAYYFQLATQIYYDIEKFDSKDYLNDVINNFYYVEANPQIYNDINASISNFNKQFFFGRNFIEESLIVPERIIYHITAMFFEACWARPTGAHYIDFDTGNIIRPPNAWPQRYKNLTSFRNVSAFYSIGRYPYFIDPNGKYEALKIPLDGEDFAVVIVLPTQGLSLKSFTNYSGDDYLRIIENISSSDVNRKRFLIPKINLPTISITERGIKINKPHKWSTFQCNSRDIEPFETSPNLNDPYSTVYVNRSFLAIIYNEKNNFPIWQGWIFDPFLRRNFQPEDDPKLLGGMFIS